MTNAELIAALRYCISDEYVKKGCLICPICAPRQGEMKCNSQDDAIKYVADALEAADKRIAELEAQLPKEGEWIELDKIKTYCSNCNWASYSMLVQKDAFILRNNKTKYCPNCGAKMQAVTDCHTLEEGER